MAIPQETLEYWKERVAGAATLQLPSDYPTPDNAQVRAQHPNILSSVPRSPVSGNPFSTILWQ